MYPHRGMVMESEQGDGDGERTLIGTESLVFVGLRSTATKVLSALRRISGDARLLRLSSQRPREIISPRANAQRSMS